MARERRSATEPGRRCHPHVVGAAVVVLVLLAAAACSNSPKAVAPATTSGSTTATSVTATTTPPMTTSTTTTAPTPADGPGNLVPANYRSLYAHLSTNLDAYAAAVATIPAAPPGTVAGTPAAELLPANGNRLDALLSPATMPSVDAWLARFHTMGIRGVTLGIKLPILLPGFSSHAAAYTAFYATVADHARRLRMTVDVELGALFCGTAFAACTKPFDGTSAQFVADTVEQARIVIARVKPDDLDILSEPTTEASLSGVKAFATVAGTQQYVHDVLAGIGPRGATKVGAGAATWLAPAYDAAILKEPVDFLDVHIYPLNPQIVANLVADTAMARAAHRPIVADEVGLYKTDSSAESGAATADSVYRKDVFSFFQPLDVRFLTITGEWAQRSGASYVSPFWPGEFFAYLTWTPALDTAPFASLNRTSNQAIGNAFRAGRLTNYGRTWPGAM